MAERFVVCPLCGFEFEKVDTLCQHGCPFRTTCNLTRCPSCDYEFPEQPRALSWMQRLFGRKTDDEIDRCEQFMTVGDLHSGETVEVISLASAAARQNHLAVFGLVPGSALTLVQKKPSYVVRIGETELALDAEIAREIMVRREQPDPKTEPAQA